MVLAAIGGEQEGSTEGTLASLSPYSETCIKQPR